MVSRTLLTIPVCIVRKFIHIASFCSKESISILSLRFFNVIEILSIFHWIERTWSVERIYFNGTYQVPTNSKRYRAQCLHVEKKIYIHQQPSPTSVRHRESIQWNAFPTWTGKPDNNKKYKNKFSASYSCVDIRFPLVFELMAGCLWSVIRRKIRLWGTIRACAYVRSLDIAMVE